MALSTATPHERSAGFLGNLLAQPFDTKRATLTGPPVAVASSVDFWPDFPDTGFFGASSGGTLAYFPREAGASRVQLAWFDRSGKIVETVGAPRDYGQIALSPSGRQVALEVRDEEGHYDLWVMDIGRGVPSRVTATPTDERDPVWSPDRRSLAFIRRSAEGPSLHLKGLRTSDPETVLMDDADLFIPESWSSDQEALMVVRQDSELRQSIWTVDKDGDGTVKLRRWQTTPMNA